MDSILVSTKKLLGIAEEYDNFDTDVMIQINSALSTLHQLGVNSDIFAINSVDTTWDDITKNQYLQNLIKTYVFLKVKLVFDPPLNSSTSSSISNQINELEWRINSIAEYESNRSIASQSPELGLYLKSYSDEI